MSKMEWKRASAGTAGTCQPCGEPTNRIVAFRQPGNSQFGPEDNPRFDAMFICDDCLEGLVSVASRRPADA
jgi:hypothetical protein